MLGRKSRYPRLKSTRATEKMVPLFEVIADMNLMRNTSHRRIELTFDGGLTLKEVFVDNDHAMVLKSYNEFLEGGYQSCNPLARYFDKPIGASSDSTCGWFWSAKIGGSRLILGMDLSSEPIGKLKDRGFPEWLRRFSPKDCNDWLLVPRLYNQVLAFGEPDWKGITDRQSDSEKQILSFSRGLVAWESQYRFLIWAADNSIPPGQVKELVNGYRRRQPEALRLLENLTIEQRSIRDIFDDHNDFFLGTPDHFASGLLSRHVTTM